MRGPYAEVKLKLGDGAVPHSCKVIRAVGVREQVLYENVKGFEQQSFVREVKGETNWVPRAFLVPKPKGKWRLVIDYR